MIVEISLGSPTIQPLRGAISSCAFSGYVAVLVRLSQPQEPFWIHIVRIIVEVTLCHLEMEVRASTESCKGWWMQRRVAVTFADQVTSFNFLSGRYIQAKHRQISHKAVGCTTIGQSQRNLEYDTVIAHWIYLIRVKTGIVD